jgi:hypothetical protein
MAFDLDGTLTVSKTRMTSEMGEVFAELLNKMPAAVMSGAGFPQMETQFLPSLPMEARLERLYLFPTNGAQCYIFRNNIWNLFYNEAFSDVEKKHILEVLHSAMERTGLETVDYQLWGERIEDRGAQITFSGLGQLAPVEEKKKWDPDKAKRRPLYDILVQELPDFSIGLNAATSIDITRKGVNKAYAIRKLVEMSQISVSEMIYVGDALSEGGNDSVVLETGVKTQEVFGPEETEKVVKEVIDQHAHIS